MVSDWESEQELAESHLMLKNAWLCFRISSSFVGNNPSLQIHSFGEDWGKCNKTGNPSISDFSTILTSDILILADSSQLPSDEAYRQCLSLPCYRFSTPCYECNPTVTVLQFFWQNFHQSAILLGKNSSILSHDICRLIRDHDPAHAIHYLWLSLSWRCQARYSFPSYLLIPASELSGDWLVHSYQASS